MNGRKALYVRAHRGALQEHGPGLTPDEAAIKIAERLDGKAPSDGDAKPDPDERPNGEDIRTPDPLDPEPDSDLLPDEDDVPRQAQEPGEEDQTATAEETEVSDPLDDGEDPDAPLSYHDVADALEVEPLALAQMEVPVLIQGQAKTATLEEVIKGYQRTQDYKAKTADLAEQRKAFEAEAGKAKETLGARFERFDRLMVQLERSVLGDKEQLTDELYDSDPDRYRKLERDIQRRTQQFQEAAQERVKAYQEDQTATVKKRGEHVSEQFQRLRVDYPKQFGADDVAKKTMSRLASFAKETYGVPEDQFNGISEAAHIEVLMDAYRWRSLKERKPERRKAVSHAPKMGRAGRAAEQGEERAGQRKKVLGKLRRTGKLRDAAAALDKLGIVR